MKLKLYHSQIGETILLYGRSFLLHDCDDFTRKYYSDVLGTPQADAIPVPVRDEKLMPVKCESSYIKFDSPEDTYVSSPSFVSRPISKNVIRQLINFPKKLRYSMRMDAVHPEDEDRDFVLEYRLSDGAIQIVEREKRNSGRNEGCFLSFRLIPKPCSTKRDDPDYYTPEDFFVGARINILNHRFVITGADLFVYRYVEANRDKFCQEVRENLRNYFLQQGMLQNDVDVEARKIQEREDECKLVADTNEKIDDNETSKCMDEEKLI